MLGFTRFSSAHQSSKQFSDTIRRYPMILQNRSVLITGGATGIGLALAKRFARSNNRVLICGRREEKLAEAKALLPDVITRQCDVALEKERSALVEWVKVNHPDVDIVINNAGIQNRPPPLTMQQEWQAHEREVATNLHAPMHLSMLFIEQLLNKESAAIMNVSSGLAFSPLAFMSTYCATKAALHSFTLSLRHQLRGTPIRVIEIIPPKVNTDLGGVGLHDDGAPLEEFADHVWHELSAGKIEFGFGFSEKNRLASRADLDRTFATLNPA